MFKHDDRLQQWTTYNSLSVRPPWIGFWLMSLHKASSKVSMIVSLLERAAETFYVWKAWHWCLKWPAITYRGWSRSCI